MREHKEAHIRLGDIEADVEYFPEQVGELRLHSNLSLYSLILQHDGLDLMNGVKCHESLEELINEDEDLNIEDAGFEGTLIASECGNEEQNGSTLSSQKEQVPSTFGNGILSKEHRLRILGQNTTRWNSNKHLKVSFVNFGLTCLGPTSGFGLSVFERCPNEVIIDLDTARLVLRRTPKSQLILSNRCAACHFYNQLTAFLAGYEIKLENENAVCTFHECDQPSFHRSGRCAQHLFNLLQRSHRGKATVDIRHLRETFNSAVRKRWEFPPYYDNVRHRVSEILQGKRAGSDLVILNVEFSPASNQVWEFALLERVSGKVLINTCVEHKDGLDHKTWDEHPFMEMMSRSKAAKVFSSSRISNIGCINADEIASKLLQVGITQDTIILVYHRSPFDLRTLRHFLESAGHHEILPRDDNCIPLLQLFRANLPVGLLGQKGVPLALENLFSVMYPRHHLVRPNHRALEGCRRMQLVCMAFDELCKPIEERGEEWQLGGAVNSTQKPSLGWLQKSYKVDSGKGEIIALKDDERSLDEQILPSESTPRSKRKARHPSKRDTRTGSTLRSISTCG
ncbi:hypothetical protein GP486_003203 [Trichoglossum hirsutum]|uniref:Uncharacterized protein n=1 Tax=Trichoglossum hirsutum TaxID=265104 RepID=A0A9P8LDI1_9PEZI|nr:hypothetical protein GP486_003203 [Trichoglossum hirsutum]